MGRSKFDIAVTDRLQLHVDIAYEKGQIVDFGLNLNGFVNEEWVDLVRYDNAHGPNHRHICYPDEEDQIADFRAAAIHTFVAQAQADLLASAELYLDEYERRLWNMLRKP